MKKKDKGQLILQMTHELIANIVFDEQEIICGVLFPADAHFRSNVMK